MASSKIIVSVIMPVYNGQRYLNQALWSIRRQSLKDLELIVIDDGSTDCSLDIIKRHEKSDSRITLLSTPRQGITRALNSASRVAEGKYLARMDCDDVAEPRRLEVQVEYLKQHEDCVAVGSWARRVDSQGWPISTWRVPTTHEEIDGQNMVGCSGQIIHPTVLMLLDAFKLVNSYDERYRYAQDYDLWLRLAEIGKLANIPEELLRYRVHTSSITLEKRAEQIECVKEALIAARNRRGLEQIAVFEHLELLKNSMVDIESQLYQDALNSGYSGTALKHALKLFFVGNCKKNALRNIKNSFRHLLRSQIRGVVRVVIRSILSRR